MQFALAELATLRHNARDPMAPQRGILMGQFLLNFSGLAFVLSLSLPLSGRAWQFTEQETDIKLAKKTQEEAIKRSKLMRPHFANGNLAMRCPSDPAATPDCDERSKASIAYENECGLSDGDYRI